MYLGQDVLSVIGKSGGNQRLLADLVTNNGDDFSRVSVGINVLDGFCSLAWKYEDDTANVPLCCDEAISFVSNYSDSASDVINCFKTVNVSGITKITNL